MQQEQGTSKQSMSDDNPPNERAVCRRQLRRLTSLEISENANQRRSRAVSPSTSFSTDTPYNEHMKPFKFNMQPAIDPITSRPSRSATPLGSPVLSRQVSRQESVCHAIPCVTSDFDTLNQQLLAVIAQKEQQRIMEERKGRKEVTTLINDMRDDMRWDLPLEIRDEFKHVLRNEVLIDLLKSKEEQRTKDEEEQNETIKQMLNTFRHELRLDLLFEMKLEFERTLQREIHDNFREEVARYLVAEIKEFVLQPQFLQAICQQTASYIVKEVNDTFWNMSLSAYNKTESVVRDYTQNVADRMTATLEMMGSPKWITRRIQMEPY